MLIVGTMSWCSSATAGGRAEDTLEMWMRVWGCRWKCWEVDGCGGTDVCACSDVVDGMVKMLTSFILLSVCVSCEDQSVRRVGDLLGDG
jgi:hypothetical protein